MPLNFTMSHYSVLLCSCCHSNLVMNLWAWSCKKWILYRFVVTTSFINLHQWFSNSSASDSPGRLVNRLLCPMLPCPLVSASAAVRPGGGPANLHFKWVSRWGPSSWCKDPTLNSRVLGISLKSVGARKWGVVRVKPHHGITTNFAPPVLILFEDVRRKEFAPNFCEGPLFMFHEFRALISKFTYKSTYSHLVSLRQWHMTCDFPKILIWTSESWHLLEKDEQIKINVWPFVFPD